MPKIQKDKYLINSANLILNKVIFSTGTFLKGKKISKKVIEFFLTFTFLFKAQINIIKTYITTRKSDITITFDNLMI